MNGKTSKKLRLITIGPHESVVKERKNREYRWAMKKKYILTSVSDDLTDEKICVIVEGPRSQYQIIKEGYKNDGRSRKAKSTDLNKAYRIFRATTKGPDIVLPKKEFSSSQYLVQPPGLGR